MLTALQALLIAAVIRANIPRVECEGVPATKAARAVPNDNRSPAGILKDGVLTLRLEMREAAWHPDGPNGCGLRVNAFAEEGKPASIPGPLIRVRNGTDVRVMLRNTLDGSVRIRGLLQRQPEWHALGLPAAQALLDTLAIEIPKGETREIRFRASVPGSFYYWGIRSAVDTAWQRNPGRLRPDLSTTEDGQLVGALVVDPPGGSPPDRIFVMTHTRVPGAPSIEDPFRAREVNAINGRSWPHSERLSATVGDTLRWRIFNPAATTHVMHLHGFYFRVVQLGSVAAFDSVYPPARQPLAVSEFMPPNRTMTIAWVPERPGNWLFHCHFLLHMSPAQRVDQAFGNAGNTAHTQHGEHAMAGPILGITVRPSGGAVALKSVAPQRTLRLYANQRPRVFGELPGLGFVLQSDDTPPAADSIRIPGTPLILTRGQPTQITVFNRLPVNLAVHWHGIELDSYFDGVPGFSGMPGSIMNGVEPGDSFVVHMAPPRAGTFIYHVHSEQFDELNSGLYGPLLVMEPGQQWEPDKDHVFVLSNAGPGDSHRTIFVNGSATPAPIEMRQGVKQRLRFISIPANGEFTVALVNPATGPVTWRPIARDGADFERESDITRASTRVDVGITRDFEFTPDQPGDLLLVVNYRVPRTPTRLTIRVR